MGASLRLAVVQMPAFLQREFFSGPHRIPNKQAPNMEIHSLAFIFLPTGILSLILVLIYSSTFDFLEMKLTLCTLAEIVTCLWGWSLPTGQVGLHPKTSLELGTGRTMAPCPYSRNHRCLHLQGRRNLAGLS